MNGFEMQGIKHTSASQINLWQNSPDVWVAEKLFGKRGAMSASAQRGIVIEKAVVDVIAYGKTEQDAVLEALATFNKFTALGASDKDRAEGEMIRPCVSLILDELKQYGEPEFKTLNKQDKIELLCKGDGWELPVTGFVDVVFPKHGLICDIKTTSRVPSEMSPEHKRQRAIYKKASGNMRVAFLYASAKKCNWLEPDDELETLSEIKNILNRQERFLRLGDKEVLRGVVHFNSNSFYWNNNKAARKEIYGI